MKRYEQVCLGLFLLLAPLWAQQNNSLQPAAAVGGPDNTEQSDTRMLTPPPVSGQAYPVKSASEERSNDLRGGVVFTSAYTDNALGALSGPPLSDISYSVAPTIALDETTPRLHSILTYAPGFTFYQRESERNEADQNALADIEYRLSPHLTVSGRDTFQKSSNIFNQPDLTSTGSVSGDALGPNFSIIAPIADRLSNYGNLALTYQFGLNSMIGAAGTFSNLHYPDPAEVPGLYDSSSQAGSVFYSLRLSQMHYVGATYQYQRLLSYPTEGTSETQTQATLFFYTFYPKSTASISLSFFGGPQYSDTTQPPIFPAQLQVPPVKAWTPAAGVSASWQGHLSSLAASYSHVISGGGGLVEAVHMDNVSLSLRRQITRTLNGSLSGGYIQNNVLGTSLPGIYSGHSVLGTASLQQRFGQHMALQLGYTRLHQDYSGVTVLSSAPDTNREFISFSYQFSRPLGR